MRIRTAAAMQGAVGWMVAAELDDGQRPQDGDAVLTGGRYMAAVHRIDCEGCAAAVESAVQRIQGVRMAGVAPKSSTLVFEVSSGARVDLADIRQTLASVSEALNTVIALSGLRGPLPALYSAA